MKTHWIVFAFVFALLPASARAHDDGKDIGSSAPGGIGGTGPFSSSNVAMHSQLTLANIGAGAGVLGNDIWGWTDSQTGKEYALFGLTDGTSFIDISDPDAPVYLGKLPSHTGNAAWRDIKVHNDHALIVADGNGSHGMQIFDLTGLRNVVSPQVFSESAHYSGFTNAHNIAVNEATGFAYAVGTNTASGGLHIVDVNDPLNPAFAGSFSSDGYTHDTQVVSYQGPDVAYAGREISFNSNEDTLTIVDVTDKNSTVQISKQGYDESAYSHQGWLTEDHRYFLMNDELDESTFATNTRTHVWDVADLDNPAYIGFHESTSPSRDHNLYIKDGLIYQANYTSGLRIFEPTDLDNAVFTEFGYFDTYPTDDAVTFNGAWSVYPFFDSGSIIVSDRQNGLFVVSAVPEPSTFALFGVIAIGVAVCRLRQSVRRRKSAIAE